MKRTGWVGTGWFVSMAWALKLRPIAKITEGWRGASSFLTVACLPEGFHAPNQGSPVIVSTVPSACTIPYSGRSDPSARKRISFILDLQGHGAPCQTCPKGVKDYNVAFREASLFNRFAKRNGYGRGRGVAIFFNIDEDFIFRHL